MRVLYHHRTLGDGAEGIHVSSIVDSLRAGGHDVKVAAVIGEKTNVTTLRTRMLTGLVRAMPRGAYELMELGYSVAGAQALRRHIAAARPDFIYERYTLFNLAGYTAARRAGIPLLLEVNAPLAYERASYEELVFESLARRTEAWLCNQADAVIVVSTPLKDHLVAQGARADRIVVLPNGADAERFQPDAAARARIRRELGIADETTVVGFTGILRPWHGVDLLLQAVARVRATGQAVHALIVGDGPSLVPLQRQAEALGIGQGVTFTGRVTHDVMPRYIAAFDIGVSPRATFYASPMKVPEYMASGVPVIAPRTPNLQDLVVEGVDGELFAAEDVDDLTRALERLAGDDGYRLALGRAARASIVTGRTWRHNADRIAALGAALAAARRPSAVSTAAKASPAPTTIR